MELVLILAAAALAATVSGSVTSRVQRWKRRQRRYRKFRRGQLKMMFLVYAFGLTSGLSLVLALTH